MAWRRIMRRVILSVTFALVLTSPRAALAQNADPSHPVGLLRGRSNRPSRCTANERDEIAPFQPIELHFATCQPGRNAGYRIGRGRSGTM